MNDLLCENDRLHMFQALRHLEIARNKLLMVATSGRDKTPKMQSHIMASLGSTANAVDALQALPDVRNAPESQL